MPACAPVFELYARYNSWFNDRLLRALCQQAGAADSAARPAAAGVVLRQLNHIFVMDLVWLHRFEAALDAAGDPEASLGRLETRPVAMEQILFWRFADMIEPRAETDEVITCFACRLTTARCMTPVTFQAMGDGAVVTRPLWSLLLHLFNHQSLHRGEIIAQFAALGVDIGPTDILPVTAEPGAEATSP